MRFNTGIKTLLKKIYLKIKNLAFLYKKVNWEKFPKQSRNNFLINFKLSSVEDSLKIENKNSSYAYLLGKPHRDVLNIYNRFIKYNPNHLGNWSFGKNLDGSRKLENEVIKMLINLYKVDYKEIEGYITSGGTEANIFSCWLGREYLFKKINSRNICLLKTSLTHYSVRKAADICRIDQFLVSLDNDLKIGENYFQEKVIELYKEGYRGFLVCLTLGYTITGSSDDFSKIDDIIKKLKKDFKNIEFFVWIDAASDGWIRAFLDKDFSPFKYESIKAFLSDFHKFGMMPYPAGFILYRKNLRKLIEKKIDYLEEKDNTLLGSRPGITAIALWYFINKRGWNYFFKKYQQLNIKKEKIFNQYKENIKKIYTNKFSLIGSFEAKKPINENILKKTKIELLINKKMIKKILYTFYLLPK